ncbi:MAG: hypothetical protein ACI8YB_002173, partial [Patiriisocius sp.]
FLLRLSLWITVDYRADRHNTKGVINWLSGS